MFLNYKIDVVNIDKKIIATINCNTANILTLKDITNMVKDYIDNSIDYINIKILQH